MANSVIKEYDNIIRQAYIQIKVGNRKPIEDILKIAQQKYAFAEFVLGKLNEEEFQNTEEAIKWYELASTHGHIEAHTRYINLIMKKEDYQAVDLRI